MFGVLVMLFVNSKILGLCRNGCANYFIWLRWKWFWLEKHLFPEYDLKMMLPDASWNSPHLINRCQRCVKSCENADGWVKKVPERSICHIRHKASSTVTLYWENRLAAGGSLSKVMLNLVKRKIISEEWISAISLIKVTCSHGHDLFRWQWRFIDKLKTGKTNSVLMVARLATCDRRVKSSSGNFVNHSNHRVASQLCVRHKVTPGIVISGDTGFRLEADLQGTFHVETRELGLSALSFCSYSRVFS